MVKRFKSCVTIHLLTARNINGEFNDITSEHGGSMEFDKARNRSRMKCGPSERSMKSQSNAAMAAKDAQLVFVKLGIEAAFKINICRA